MRRLLRNGQRFARLSRREQVWFVLLFVGCGLARAALLTLPFRRLVPYMGAHAEQGSCPPEVSEDQQRLARRIGRLTALAAQYTPWQSACLVQALVAARLLAYYHIPYVLHLGVAKTTPPSDGFQAHAWLRVGPWIVTGREGYQAFTVVGTFVAPATLPSGDTIRP